MTPETLALLVEKYPDGYDDGNVISFKNSKNALIEAVELITEDTKYLVKVSTKLDQTMKFMIKMTMKILKIMTQKHCKIEICRQKRLMMTISN